MSGFILVDRLLPSALLPNTVYCINKTRLFIKILNNKRPIDPCGTPATTVFVMLALLLITTLCYNFLNDGTLDLMHLRFLLSTLDYHVTFENQLCKLKVKYSYRTLFVYIGFSLRLLIHVVKGLWAYSSLSLTYLLFCTEELLQTSLVHLEKYSHEENG